jgi:YbbR-like protein
MTRLLRLVTHNLGWKIGSLALSYLLWLTLVAQPEMTTVQTLPVLYKNLPTGLALGPGTPETVHVELRGTSNVLSRDNLSEAMVTLDLDGTVIESARTFPVSSAEMKLPQGVTFVRADPAELSVKLTSLIPKPDNRK